MARDIVSNRAQLRSLAEGAEAPATTVEEFELEEFERVRFSLYLAVVCEAIPRRLGKDADPAALALDKRIARKVANLYRSAWMSHARIGAPEAPTWSSRSERLALARDAEPAARKAGAQVKWGAWLTGRYAELETRRRVVAALAVEAGRPKWGVRRVRILNDERASIERIAAETRDRARRLK